MKRGIKSMSGKKTLCTYRKWLILHHLEPKGSKNAFAPKRRNPLLRARWRSAMVWGGCRGRYQTQIPADCKTRAAAIHQPFLDWEGNGVIDRTAGTWNATPLHRLSRSWLIPSCSSGRRPSIMTLGARPDVRTRHVENIHASEPGCELLRGVGSAIHSDKYIMYVYIDSTDDPGTLEVNFKWVQIFLCFRNMQNAAFKIHSLHQLLIILTSCQIMSKFRKTGLKKAKMGKKNPK